MTASPQLSVIIPAYNEERRLPVYLARVIEYLERQPFPAEIIIVDDGSRDGTAAVVERFAAKHSLVRLIRLPRNRGKGHAVKTGMIAASGRMRLFADADGATPIAEVERLQNAIAAGADVAVGSRALRDEALVVKARIHRRFIGTVFNFIVRTLTVRGINDTQCGFKLFTARAADVVFSLQQIDDFGFDVELLYISRRNGFLIAEVPVNWTDIPGTKVKIARDSLRMLKDVFKIRLHDLRGGYRDRPS